MQLHEIKLTNYKNYPSEQFQFSEKINCIVGLNGMGKTNLLDAIYYCSMTKSAFATNDRNVVLNGESFFRLEANFIKQAKKLKLVAKVQPGKSKVFEKNEVAYSKMSEHIGALPIVIIEPDDTDLAKEGSEERRRFLDNTLSQSDSDYLKNLMTYNRILRQRNSALKEFGAKGNYNTPLIQTYNQQLIPCADLIFEKRKVLTKALSPIFNQFYQLLSNNQEQVECLYQSQLLENNLGDLLSQSMDKDRILQRTTCGIHKDNLVFKINGFPVKKFASQGQLKSFVIALKFAQYELLRQEKQLKPILLLDDIFDKLDANRVGNLIQILLEKDFGQIFLTDTEENRVPNILNNFTNDFKKFIIEKGSIKISSC